MPAGRWASKYLDGPNNRIAATFQHLPRWHGLPPAPRRGKRPHPRSSGYSPVRAGLSLQQRSFPANDSAPASGAPATGRALEARFNFPGRLPGRRTAVFTQAADDQFHVRAILQRRIRLPHPETTGMFRQGSSGATHRFGLRLQVDGNFLIQHQVKMHCRGPLCKRLLLRTRRARWEFLTKARLSIILCFDQVHRFRLQWWRRNDARFQKL